MVTTWFLWVMSSHVVGLKENTVLFSSSASTYTQSKKWGVSQWRNPKLATTVPGSVSHITHKCQCLCHILHIHGSVCVTHYTGPTILASNCTLTLSWPSVMPGLWYPSQPALRVSQAPWYPSQAALWSYSGTGGGTPPGHTQILPPHNL